MKDSYSAYMLIMISCAFGFLTGIAVSAYVPDTNMEKDGYERGVRDCMAGKAAIDTTTTVKYQPR